MIESLNSTIIKSTVAWRIQQNPEFHPNFGRSQHEFYVFPCSFQDEEARFSAVQAPAPRSHWPSESRRRYGYGKAGAGVHPRSWDLEPLELMIYPLVN